MSAAPPCRACYVGTDQAIRTLLPEVWGPDLAEWTFYGTGGEAAGNVMASPPDILLCSLDLGNMTGLELAALIKEENVYSQVPVIVCMSPEEAGALRDWHTIVDDFLIFPNLPALVRIRLDLVRERATRTLDANPLTKLPGNTSIIKSAQAFIEENRDFAFGYCDLDFFKAYNDKYGFSRGDEVLMVAARIILKSVQDLSLDISFVGHVGGDDFVFIVPVDAAETVCRRIVSAFDAIIPQFYDDEDRAKGYIVSTDRQDIVCSFPLMSMSIAVVFNENGSLKHFGEASSTAMSLKKVAKKSLRSSYVMDRRNRASANPAS